MDELTQSPTESAQRKFFRVADNIPEETWYWMALASIGVSAGLKLANRDHWALFVGQWPPTFILFGLYHRLLRPSSKPKRSSFPTTSGALSQLEVASEAADQVRV